MTTYRHHWRSLCWSPPQFFDELRREGDVDCIRELIRSFTYFTSTRLQLLADPRAWNERETAIELKNLKDSCRQVGAERMAFLCCEMEREGLNPETEAFRGLVEALRTEGQGVMQDMRAYAIALESRTMSAAAGSAGPARVRDTALSGLGLRQNVLPFTSVLGLRRRESASARTTSPTSSTLGNKNPQ